MKENNNVFYLNPPLPPTLFLLHLSPFFSLQQNKNITDDILISRKYMKAHFWWKAIARKIPYLLLITEHPCSSPHPEETGGS